MLQKSFTVLLILIFSFYMFHGLLVVKIKDWNPSEEHHGKPLASVPVGKTIKGHELTFCFRFQIHGRFRTHYGLSAIQNLLDLMVWFRFQENYGFILFNSKVLIFQIPEGIMRPFSWYHFCSSFNQTHYKIVVDGEVWFENGIIDYTSPLKIVENLEFQLDELVVFGSGLNGKLITF